MAPRKKSGANAAPDNGNSDASKNTRKPAPGNELSVGIGASPGSLEAFKAFLAHMPADSDLAFVLVQHRAPHHTSLLAELLGHVTGMRVLEAADGARVQLRHIYVVPPNANLTIANRTLQVCRPAPLRKHRWPINTFFNSLALGQGDQAVSIMLAGTGSDGSKGLRAVKEHGGLALAQSTSTTRR
jgi:two-component system CheB/CheR fusion protein